MESTSGNNPESLAEVKSQQELAQAQLKLRPHKRLPLGRTGSRWDGTLSDLHDVFLHNKTAPEGEKRCVQVPLDGDRPPERFRQWVQSGVSCLLLRRCRKEGGLRPFRIASYFVEDAEGNAKAIALIPIANN